MSIYDICSCGHPRGVHLVGDPSTGSCDLRNCRCCGFVLAPSMKEQLRESKQREATLTLERDAALNIIDAALTECDKHIAPVSSFPTFDYTQNGINGSLNKVKRVLSTTPTAALAERDREID